MASASTTAWTAWSSVAISYGEVAYQPRAGRGKITTGAAQDIQHATDVARRMVTQYGMSDTIGPIAIGDREAEIFLGREVVQRREISERTAELVDTEVKRILGDAYERAKTVLLDRRDALDRLAAALLERETLDREEVEMVVAGKPLPRCRRLRPRPPRPRPRGPRARRRRHAVLCWAARPRTRRGVVPTSPQDNSSPPSPLALPALPDVLGLRPMEAKNADLAALADQPLARGHGGRPAGQVRRWLLIGLPTAAILVVGGVFVISGGALRAALPVRLTPATMVSPMRCRRRPRRERIRRGAAEGRRRFEGHGPAGLPRRRGRRPCPDGAGHRPDRRRRRQRPARAGPGQPPGQSRGAARCATVAGAGALLADSGASSQASVDAAEARYERVTASIAAAEAAVLAAHVSLENTVIRAPFDARY